jgi:hypothetical protein
MENTHKICVCIIDNDFSALKILYNSLLKAGYRLQDIIFVELDCASNSIGYDIMFNVTKIACKTPQDLATYQYDTPLLDDHGNVPTYVFVTENVEFTNPSKEMIDALIRDKPAHQEFLLHKNQYSCFRIGDKITDVITHEMYQIVHTTDMEYLRGNASLVGFTHKFNVYLVKECNLLVYIR